MRKSLAAHEKNLVKIAVFLQQSALTKSTLSCRLVAKRHTYLNSKTAGLFECVWSLITTLHERFKVISLFPNNVWKKSRFCVMKEKWKISCIILNHHKKYFKSYLFFFVKKLRLALFLSIFFFRFTSFWKYNPKFSISRCNI